VRARAVSFREGIKASKTDFLFDLKVAARLVFKADQKRITAGVIRDAGYPGSSDRLDNHLAGVRFLTFIQPDLRLFRKVEMWNSRSISSNELQVVCGRKLDSVAPMIQLRAISTMRPY
jgi:hypothetical protein